MHQFSIFVNSDLNVLQCSTKCSSSMSAPCPCVSTPHSATTQTSGCLDFPKPPHLVLPIGSSAAISGGVSRVFWRVWMRCLFTSRGWQGCWLRVWDRCPGVTVWRCQTPDTRRQINPGIPTSVTSLGHVTQPVCLRMSEHLSHQTPPSGSQTGRLEIK